MAVLSRFAEEVPESLIDVRESERTWRPTRRARPRRESVVETGPRHVLGTIIHPTFGRGDVISQEGNGPDARLTVIFDGNIKKKIVARFAEWEESHVDF